MAEALADGGHAVRGVTVTVADAVLLARRNRPDVAILDIQSAAAESGDFAQMGLLYVTGRAERVYQEARAGHACLKNFYESRHYVRLKWRDIARDGRTSRAVQRGLRHLIRDQNVIRLLMWRRT